MQAVRMLSITDGAERPYAKLVTSKLVAVQANLKSADIALLGVEACLLCGESDTKLMQCGRCHEAAYCCRAHQRAQWKVHKKSCEKAQH